MSRNSSLRSTSRPGCGRRRRGGGGTVAVTADRRTSQRDRRWPPPTGCRCPHRPALSSAPPQARRARRRVRGRGLHALVRRAIADRAWLPGPRPPRCGRPPGPPTRATPTPWKNRPAAPRRTSRWPSRRPWSTQSTEAGWAHRPDDTEGRDHRGHAPSMRLSVLLALAFSVRHPERGRTAARPTVPRRRRSSRRRAASA